MNQFMSQKLAFLHYVTLAVYANFPIQFVQDSGFDAL